MTSPDLIELRLLAMRHEAEGIVSLELARPDGAALPAFSAGAHVDLHLGAGLARSYSLVNPSHETHRWVVAVNLDAASRGGSRHVHERLRVGQLLQAAGPRNHFPLDEDAAHSVLIAGGIGITPLLCMAERLQAIGRRWQLHYGARQRSRAAFVDRLRALAEASALGSLHLHVDDEAQGRPLDVAAIVASAPADAQLYACGPKPLLAAFDAATTSRPPANVHRESFTPAEPVEGRQAFRVRLARSDRALDVPPGRSVLDVLLDAGVEVSYSCQQGFCGTCEVRVLAGTPDHHDLVLTEAERAANQTMMVCCSGACSPELVLDL